MLVIVFFIKVCAYMIKLKIFNKTSRWRYLEDFLGSMIKNYTELE